MSGVHGALIGHMVKRGVEVVHNHYMGPSPEIMEKLQHDAELYENAGPEMEVAPESFLPMLILGLIVLFAIASVRYTVGEVMASLAMIESPSSTAIIEPKPPAYSDSEADATSEKETFKMADEEADVEITVINHKPITSSLKATIRHLYRVGGFRARWRGVGVSMIYHAMHAGFVNLLASFMGLGLVGNVGIYIFVSVGLARLHMLWTHTMIAQPSSKPWYRRFVTSKDCKALLLPTLVYAAAQQATFILPILVAFSLKLHQVRHEDVVHAGRHENCAMMMMMGLRFLAVPATAIFVALMVLLPAAVTLTRVEAVLLSEDEETIVPFDRAAIMGDVDLTVSAGRRALFVQAWRSFDRASRWRLIKLYVKMVMVQAMIVMTAIPIAILQVYFIGGEQLLTFVKSASAQLQLQAIEAKQNAN